MKNHYEQLIKKQAELTTLVAKLAAENRAPSAEEKNQLETIKTEVAAIEKAFADEGRKLALARSGQRQSAPAGSDHDSQKGRIAGDVHEAIRS